MSIDTEFEQTEKFYNKIRVITGFVHYRDYFGPSSEFKCRFVGVRRGNIIVFIPRLGYYKRANLTKLYKIMKEIKTTAITLNVHDLGIHRLNIHYWNEIKVDQELYKSFFPYTCNE